MNYSGKELVLFGQINLCERFYVMLKNLVPISAMITDDEAVYNNNKEECTLELRYVDDWRNYDITDCYFISCYLTENERFYCDEVMAKLGLFYEEDYVDAIYVLAYYSQKYKVEYEKKNIWIFGAGNNGKSFYELNEGNGIKIAGFVSNYEDEILFQDLPVIRPNELKDFSNVYIVICSEAWKDMSRQLEYLGYKGLRDYCFCDLTPKKIFVANGPCQIYNSARMMCQKKKFLSKYYFLLMAETLDSCCSAADKRRVRSYSDVCDVVFYRSKSLGNDGLPDCGQEIVERYYNKAIKIGIPFNYFRGQLMQTPMTVNPYGVRHNGTYFWIRGDQEVNRLVNEGYSVEQIVEMVSDINYWDAEYIIDNFNMELKKIKVLDRLSSIEISEFIEKNYQKIIFFRDGTHLGIELMLFITNEIFKILDIDEWTEDEKKEIIEKTEPVHKNLMPVYPCVKKALNMENADDSGQYIFVKSDLSVELVDFKEYIRRYAEYAYSVRNMINDNGILFW